MFTNRHDLAIHIRKILSDRNGKINPVRNLSLDEFRIASDIILGAEVPLSRGFLEFNPGHCTIVRLMSQVDIPDFAETKILPFAPT